MKYKLTTFQIGEMNKKIELKKGISVNLYEIFVSRNSSTFSKAKINCYSISNYSNTEYLEVLYSDRQEIKLPNKMKERLLKFIINEKTILEGKNKKFDCLSFVNYLNGIEPENRKGSNYKYYKLHSLQNLNVLEIGDTILTGVEKLEKGGHHYSIYLGKGLYLGILGLGQFPAVYDIETLQKIYPFDTTEILLCIPNNN